MKLPSVLPGDHHYNCGQALTSLDVLAVWLVGKLTTTAYESSGARFPGLET
jgi:hypothetical protein